LQISIYLNEYEKRLKVDFRTGTSDGLLWSQHWNTLYQKRRDFLTCSVLKNLSEC